MEVQINHRNYRLSNLKKDTRMSVEKQNQFSKLTTGKFNKEVGLLTYRLCKILREVSELKSVFFIFRISKFNSEFEIVVNIK